MERSDQGRDINVLDGVALVMGSAIASVHLLRVIRSGLSPAGWIMIWLTFSCVALTAAGPFIFLAQALFAPASRISQGRRLAVDASRRALGDHGHHRVRRARRGAMP